MTGVHPEQTFWQFTASSARSALRLYFEPIYRAVAWLGNERVPQSGINELEKNFAVLRQEIKEIEHRVYAAPDSLSGLELRVLRLSNDDSASPALMFAIEKVQAELTKLRRLETLNDAGDQKELLGVIRAEVKRLEHDLTSEGPAGAWSAGAD